ncbi:hypothetical protein [Streptomyces sp. NPDC048357]|uniref:hypothetical protein n=1 Tax=Streptomyces sp. NPDC048357 TaxID=3154719 RepID=UPI00343D96CB
MSRVTLTATDPTGAGRLDTSLLTALLRAAAAPSEAPEHISVHRGPGRIELVFFHTLDSPAEAAAAGRELCRRLLTTADRLSAWDVLGASREPEEILHHRRTEFPS